MANGELIKELRELAKSDDLPSRVTNRLILTAVIQLYNRTEDNAQLKTKVSRLEGIVALLSTMWIAVLGYLFFSG